MTFRQLLPLLLVAMILGVVAYGCWAVTVSASHVHRNCVFVTNCVVD